MIKLKHLLKETIINEYGLPNIKDNPKRHAASELLTFLDWPTSFYEKVLKVKEEEDQLMMMKRLQEIQWLTVEIKSDLEKKDLDNNRDLADALVSYVEENPFGPFQVYENGGKLPSAKILINPFEPPLHDILYPL